MKQIKDIQDRNRLLFMELQNLNLNTVEGRTRREELRDEIGANNLEMTGIAKAMGSREQMPRLYKYCR